MTIKNIPKRHFYNEKDYKLNYEKKQLILNTNFHKKLLDKKLWNKFGFKKIGGSSVGDVLEVDDYKSSFAAFCRMAWCGLPILDRKYVDAGIAIEPKVIFALEKKLKTSIKTFKGEEYDFDYFKDKDEIIGGLPDAYLEKEKIIIEIKTTSIKNYDLWNRFGLPTAYLKQAQLYSYLMDVDKFWIVATFLYENDYDNPEDFPITQRIVKNYKFNVEKSQVEDDIKEIKQWYLNHTQSGISPKWDEKKDKDLIEYLECKNEEEYIELLKKWKIEGKFVDN